jgi:S-adenosyl-L-methionine hydrolase (adenosine-forming)
MRPFISFLTDFGPDSAAAVCRGVMLSIAPDAQIIDISHAVRKYAIRDGAFLLSASLPWMPVGVHVAVVDPGVGTQRRPIGLRAGRGDVLIGPDNGLLIAGAQALGGIVEARELENRAWMLERTSSTFHGRDIFSPMAAHLAIGGDFAEVGSPVELDSLAAIPFPAPEIGDGVLNSSIVYIDSFGNLRLAGEAGDLARAVGELTVGRAFRLEFAAANGGGPIVETAPWARTFGEIPAGQPLLYEDSSGRLAFADNQADVARRLGVGVDRPVTIRPA